jgi:hypothetical protein
MDTTALVVIGLAVLVIVLVLMFARGSRRVNHADLVPLSDESRDRYLTEWGRIETRFVDAPEEAVREADSVVMSVLRERRHPLETRRLPRDVEKARRDASMGRGDRTEGMRRAMLRYRAVMEKMVGMPVRDRKGRRELA